MRSGCLRGEQSVAQPCGLRTPAWENFPLPSVGGQELGCGGPFGVMGPAHTFCSQQSPQRGHLTGFLAGPWAPGKSR